jgi:DNA-binding response OmpR family regulator
VEILKDARIDAVLLDLQMPGHDGFETLEYLQEHRRGLPVLLLSGLPADEIQDRMHRLSSGQLPPLFLKPCDYDQLLDVLDLMLSGELPPNL